jgi:hypothetical protein
MLDSPHWVEHQRRRFMRPDAERWMRPDAARFNPLYERKGRGSRRKVVSARELEELHDGFLELKRLVAGLKFDLAYRAFQRKYRADQPRIPAGSREGGQWTGEGGDGGLSTDLSAARGRPRLGSKPDGHHFVHHSLYSKLPLRDDTRKVFDEAKTGRLHAERHGNSREHRVYNDAVRGHFERFLADNNIQPETMTPDQARQLVREVMQSRNPGIRDLNLRIYRKEILNSIRRMPRRSE